MKRIKNILSESIATILKGYGIDLTDIKISETSDLKFGHYTTNDLIKVFNLLSDKNDYKNPIEFAKNVAKDKIFDSLDFLEKVDVAGPGFLNFYIKDDFFVAELNNIVSSERYGENTSGNGMRMIIDYSSPNIAKRFSVGHLRSTIIGQAIRNLYNYSGWQTVGDNHLGDWGTQFGVIISGLEDKYKDLTDDLLIHKIKNMSINEFEEIYVEYTKKAIDDPSYRDKAKRAFAKLENNDVLARKIWMLVKDISLNEYDYFYNKLNVHIENQYGESYYEDLMKEVISELETKSFYTSSEGAKIIEFDDLPPILIVKSDGTTTYFTRDLATVKFRLENPDKFGGYPDKPFDLLIYEVGAEQILHFRQLFKAIDLLGWAKNVKFKHVAHGFIRLPEGKMSTRKGNTIKLEDIISQAESKSLTIIGEKGDDGKKDREFMSGVDYSAISIGSIKYNDLKRAPHIEYIFNFDEVINMEGNSAPYIMYTNVRALSVIEKSGKDTSLLNKNKFKNIELSDQEKEILYKIYTFPDIVLKAGLDFAPNQICTYLFELSQIYNSFYNANKIIGSEIEDFRLILSRAVSTVLVNGLDILGIKAPNKM